MEQDATRACFEKKRYTSEAQAQFTATECWYKRRVWLRAYACTSCGGWHLTRKDAPPAMQPNWRLPKISERARNEQRKRRRGRR